MPGKEFHKIDNVLLGISANGAEKLQGFINDVFDISPNAVKNDQGGLTTEPYKNKSPQQIRAELEKKSLNKLNDDAASDTSFPGQAALFKQVLSDYFVNMTKADKRSTLAAALRYANTFDFGNLQGEELESARKEATTRFAGAILKGTSPLPQKMMQGLPRTILGNFASALDDMKSRLAPIPIKIVQAHLVKMLEDSNGKIQSITLKKSLGAASVGEAFLCEFSYAGDDGEPRKEDFVVKIMRHDAESRVRREAEIITIAAKKLGSGMAKTWEWQLNQYMTEFDFRIEAQNIQTGTIIYGQGNPAVKTLAPSVGTMELSTVAPTTKNVLVATVASGGTVDRFFAEKSDEIRTVTSGVFKRDAASNKLVWDEKKKPVVKEQISAKGFIQAASGFDTYDDLLRNQKSMLQASKLWLHEAILGSGQFHGDAHSGNLMIDPYTFKISFIDFGNLYSLQTHYAKDEQGNIIMDRVREKNDEGVEVEVEKPRVLLDERVELLRIILGAALRDKNFFLQGFEKLLSPDGKVALQANREKAEAILDAILPKGLVSIDACYRLQAAIKELQKLGLELPPQINCFIQSLTRLQNTIDEMNSILNQTRAVVDTMNDLPPLAAGHPQPDPLDVLSQILDFARSPEGKKKEAGRKGHANREVPAYFNKMQDFRDTGFKTYQSSVQNRLLQSQNPADEAMRLADMFRRHLNLDDEDDVAVSRELDEDVAKLQRELASAQNDEEKTLAIETFAGELARMTREVVYEMLDNNCLLRKFEPPQSFATVIMSTLFNSTAGANMLYKNFSFSELKDLVSQAGSIAHKELGLSYFSKFNLANVTQSLIQSAQSMPGDTSYKVEIGI